MSTSARRARWPRRHIPAALLLISMEVVVSPCSAQGWEASEHHIAAIAPPPDPTLAVDADEVVIANQQEMLVYDKSGTLLETYPLRGASGLWGNGPEPFDPELAYDPHADRFWLIAVDKSSPNQTWFRIAVSSEEGPLEPWHTFSFDAEELGACLDEEEIHWIDSPNISVRSNCVWFSATFQVYVDGLEWDNDTILFRVNKAPMLDGDDPTDVHCVVVDQRWAEEGLPRHWDEGTSRQYLIDLDPDYPSDLDIWQTTFPLDNVEYDRIVLRAATLSAGLPPTISITSASAITVTPYYTATGAPQDDSNQQLYTADSRFWSSVYRDGDLWAVHHVRASENGPNVVRWYQFDMTGWSSPTLTDSGTITPAGGADAYFPSIDVNSSGDAVITFSQSDDDEFISIKFAIKLSTEGDFDTPVTVLTSDTDYAYEDAEICPGGGTCFLRWGDYSGTQFDPTDSCVVWGHAEYVDDADEAVWRTRVYYASIQPACTFANFDGDKDVDLDDLLKFRDLMSQSDRKADVNRDEMLDADDWAAMLKALHGE